MMEPYKEYKDTEIPWLSRIPSHWSIQRAKTMYAKINRPVRKEDDVITCFRDGIVTLRKNRRTTGFTEAIQEFGYQGIRKGDLVIHVMDAFAGAVGVSDSDGKGTPVYSVCMAQGDFNNYYYAHIVREMAKTGFIQSLYRGIRERSSDFRFDVFGSQLLPIPPRSEQDQIVRFLDWKVSLINKYLSAKQKQIELINNLITLVVTNNISSHSKSRKRVRLKHLVKTPLQYGANESGSDYSDKFPRYIRITDITLDGLLKNVNKLSLSVPDYSKFLLNDGDILLARSGATIGKSFIYKEKYGPCCFAGYLIRVIPNKEKIIPEFLNYFTQTQIYKEWLNTIFIQSTIQNVSAEKYNNLQIPLPPLNEQLNIVNAISKQLENLQKLLMLIADKINLMQEYRARLISDVVSGRVDVRGVAAPDYEAVEETANTVDEDSKEMEGEEQ